MMLDLLFGPSRRRAGYDWWGGGSFTPWIAGRVRTQAQVVVDENIALTYAACWCCTRIIAETAASLPLFTYRRDLSGNDRGDVSHATQLSVQCSAEPFIPRQHIRPQYSQHRRTEP